MENETASWPVAVYLRDGDIGLRAPVPEDAEQAGAWYEGAFPISPERARDLLTEQETIPWGNNPTIRLIAVDLPSGTVVGGVLVERDDNRVSKIRITVGGPNPSAEDSQRMHAALLRLVVPWVMGELNMMTAVIDIPSDETILIDAARGIGMVEAVRLREHIARPLGRVDLLMLELVDSRWGQGDA